MASEFVKADHHGLYVLVQLVDDFWSKPHPLLAAEIRQQRAVYGLTPLDRRRLQWQIERDERDDAREARGPAPDAVPADGGIDPRFALRAVK